ncbi:MAG: type III secretion system chaperone [Kiritimatiellae bacterium]|nr:type III secretion system chaperone [Kiritimatiellia bacterium]
MATKEDYTKFLKQVREETGIEALVPDDGGLVSVRVDDRFNVNLQFVEATGRVLCFVEVAQLSADASKDVYRDLLAGGLFGKETAGGYFALEPETETVVYNYFFDFAQAAEDTEAFVETLEKILQLCDIWSERIKAGHSRDGQESYGDSAHGGRIFV